MSKQVGLIKLKGNLGGVSFYQSEGSHLAKIANGPSRERILNDKAFQRTRENNTEFGGSATAAKAFRTSLSGVQHMFDPRLVSRLTSIFKNINAKGDGVRGQRPIDVTEHADQLVNLELNINRSFASLCAAPFTASNATERNSATISFADLIAGNGIKAPAGATHFVLSQALGVVSDYNFNESTKRYEPLEPVLNTQGAVSYSDYLPVNSPSGVAVNLITELPGSPELNENVGVIQCLGIEFFQFISGSHYPLFQGTAMKVIRVF
jgi:hypothetical protein